MEKHIQPIVNSDTEFVYMCRKKGKQLLVQQLVLQWQRIFHLEDLKDISWPPSFSVLCTPHLKVSFPFRISVHFRNSDLTYLYNFKSISLLLLHQLLIFFFSSYSDHFSPGLLKTYPVFVPHLKLKLIAIAFKASHYQS